MVKLASKFTEKEEYLLTTESRQIKRSLRKKGRDGGDPKRIYRSGWVEVICPTCYRRFTVEETFSKYKCPKDGYIPLPICHPQPIIGDKSGCKS